MKVYHFDDIGSTHQPAQLCFTKFSGLWSFSYFLGVGWGKIEIKDHLIPAEAEIWAELGNINDVFGNLRKETVKVWIKCSM